ncbi:MAG: Flp family type IVb pilin [Pseudomonadota bacterium]
MTSKTLYGRTLSRFLRDERGATAVEYAIIAAGIAAVIVSAVSALGTTVKGLYEAVSAAMG